MLINSEELHVLDKTCTQQFTLCYVYSLLISYYNICSNMYLSKLKCFLFDYGVLSII